MAQVFLPSASTNGRDMLFLPDCSEVTKRNVRLDRIDFAIDLAEDLVLKALSFTFPDLIAIPEKMLF
jgi:hypothetical protein